MLIKRPPDIRPSEITPEHVYRSRRRFMRDAAVAAAAAGGLVPGVAPAALERLKAAKTPYPTDAEPTPFEATTNDNNFHQSGQAKGDPARYGGEFHPEPWSVTVDGECDRPGKYTLEDILKPHALEERIYRLRCVEAWSMVIPWIGFPLRDLIKRFEPNSNARYVAF